MGVLKTLQINNEIIADYSNYKYPAPNKDYHREAPRYHEQSIFQGVIALNTLEKTFGETKFVNAMLQNNYAQNMNALEYVIKENKKGHCEYLCDFVELKKFYNAKIGNAVTDNRIYRLLFSLFVMCKDDTIIDYVLGELRL